MVPSMASQITLPFWPTSLDCLSWSDDNIIAVAGGDQIGILSPRLHGAGPNGTHWNSTVFKANAFTAAEVPQFDPLTSSNWSVGEELSLRHVDRLEWSPPGIGRFRQCVLAVLSTNHVLSIWECDGKAEVSGSWRRKVIINHALRDHYAKLRRAEGETELEHVEREQISQRIRAFAWAPQGGVTAHNATTASWNRNETQFLAVSTEAGDVVILRIRPPYDILNPTIADWQVEVFHSVTLLDEIPDTEIKNFKNRFNNDKPCARSCVADYLAWIQLDTYDKCYAMLAFITNGRLFCLAFNFESGGHVLNSDSAGQFISTGKTMVNAHINRLSDPDNGGQLDSQSKFTGPLKFRGGSQFLTVFASDTVYCVSMDPPVRENPETKRYYLDAWDEVSGVAFTQDAGRLSRIQIIFHLSSLTSATTTFEIPEYDEHVSIRPQWQITMLECKDAFSDKYDLGGHVQERTWGIACCPLGESTATAITLLPSDSVAHIIPSDQRTIINITEEVFLENDDFISLEDKISSTRNVTSETVLFNLQRRTERGEGNLDVDVLMELKNGHVTHLKEPFLQGESSALPDFNAWDVETFRHRVLDLPEIDRERYRALAGLASGEHAPRRPISPKIVQHLVSEVLNLPSNIQHDGGELSHQIRRAYSVVKVKLQATVLFDDPHTHKDDGDFNETCRICSKAIPFMSLRWARCDGGHQFSRCGLTFLAIQIPDVSKHCGVCGAQMFNEWKIPALQELPTDQDVQMADESAGSNLNQDIQVQEATEGNAAKLSRTTGLPVEPVFSLARIMFSTFDTCIYCGGKFIG